MVSQILNYMKNICLSNRYNLSYYLTFLSKAYTHLNHYIRVGSSKITNLFSYFELKNSLTRAKYRGMLGLTLNVFCICTILLTYHGRSLFLANYESVLSSFLCSSTSRYKSKMTQYSNISFSLVGFNLFFTSLPYLLSSFR